MDASRFLALLSTIKWFMEPNKAIVFGGYLYHLLENNITIEGEVPIYKGTVSRPDGSLLPLFSKDQGMDILPNDDDAIPADSTLVLPVKGPMFKEDTWFSYGTESIGEIIRMAADHQNIKAIVEDFDTGGGAVDSIFPIVDANLYARSKKPVIGIGDLVASAGYYSIVSTDLVIASNDISSEFGSIGVMLSFADLQPYWEKLGVKFYEEYAPESNFKNLPFRQLLQGKPDLIRNEVLSPLAKKFQADVRKYRGGKVDITQKGILNGRMFYAKDAVKYGLADEIGNLEYAIKRAGELASNRK